MSSLSAGSVRRYISVVWRDWSSKHSETSRISPVALRVFKAQSWRSIRIRNERHSFASRALALGEGLPMIGKLPGHTQVQTTARYAHHARDTVKASAARIGDSIDNDLDAAP